MPGVRDVPDVANSVALAAVVALTLGAFLLRVYRLDLQSLTGDEAYSMLAAQRWLSGGMDIYGGSNEPTPPLYYVLLVVWARLTGVSEFAGRYMSVVFGVALVPATYRVTATVAGRLAALVVAALVAASPFLIAYSQTARCYALLGWLSAVSTIALVRLLDSPGETGRSCWRLRLAYVAATLFALYTHTFAVFLLVFHSALFTLSSARRRGLREWAVLQAVILIVYTPWILRVLALSSDPAGVWFADVGPLALIARLFAAFTVGMAAPVGKQVGLLAGLGAVVFLVGALAGLRRGGIRGGRVAAAWFALPLAAMVLASLRMPVLLDRFFTPYLPGYLLGIAVGVAVIWRRGRSGRALAAALSLVLVAGGAALALPSYYRTTVFASAGQVRDLRAYVAREAKPDAAVVVNLPPSDPFFQYYSLDRPTSFVSDAQPNDRSMGVPTLEGLVGHSGEIWLLPFGYGDEGNHFVESYLGSVGFKTEDRWFGNLRLVRYSLAKDGAGPRHDLADAATLVHPNGRVRLAGYRLAPERARPGDALTVTLYWRPDGPLATNYKVFVHLDDPSGKTIAQRDAEPLSGQRPTTGWRAGEEIADNYGLALPADLPPGEYRLDLGLYELAGGERLLLPSGENHLIVASVIVDR